ncbi:MAG TPA: response regulator [Verrucomicrobiae bacterium]|nr:response regulator [Verrucomicrobiae bacterium]
MSSLVIEPTNGEISAEPKAHSNLPLRGIAKILLVDDEERNLEVLESILASPDLQLIRAQTPEAALLALVRDEFACIVLDVQMPGMTGLELASLIKTRKRCSHVPIIFLTAFFNSERDILQGYGAGAVDYLTKPLNPQILKSKVGVFVDLFNSNRALMALNDTLEQEIARRQHVEEALNRANTELASVNHSLRNQIREREQLETAVLNISEQEQQRIGQDLHDGLCQYLTGLKFRSTLLEQKLQKHGIAEAADARMIESLLSQAIEHARHLARGLNPVRLEADGLAIALRELAASVASLFGVRCTFLCPSPIPRIDQPRAIHLFRIAQEATSNAIKHGRATTIVIQLNHQPGNIDLTVEDDGRGLSKEIRDQRGTGMYIMNYRARTIGATLEIQPGANGGVTVTCSLPCERTPLAETQ